MLSSHERLAFGARHLVVCSKKDYLAVLALGWLVLENWNHWFIFWMCCPKTWSQSTSYEKNDIFVGCLYFFGSSQHVDARDFQVHLHLPSWSACFIVVLVVASAANYDCSMPLGAVTSHCKDELTWVISTGEEPYWF